MFTYGSKISLKCRINRSGDLVKSKVLSPKSKVRKLKIDLGLRTFDLRLIIGHFHVQAYLVVNIFRRVQP